MQHSATDCVCSRIGTRLLFALSLCCCGTRPTVAFDSIPETRGRGSKLPSSSPAESIDSEISQAVRMIADLRGWESNLSVRVEVAAQDRIVQSILADLRSQMAPDVFRAQQDFLAAFGWAPADFDFERDVVNRFARELSGVYCVTSQRVLLAGNIDRESARRTLRHELVHAFQDARYDLGAKTRWASDRGDYIAAIHALAEGEATCIEAQLSDPHHRGCLDPAFDDSRSSDGDSDQRLMSVPRVVRRSLYAPYVDGVRYVRQLLLQGGWAALERAWNGRLQSTRAVLRGTERESSRLLSMEVPRSIGQCELRFLDVVGEESLRSLVWDMAAPSELESVLESLDGERAAVWQCVDRCVAGMRLHFGNASAATVFARWLGDSSGVALRGGAVTCVLFGDRAVSLRRHGQDIAIASVRPCHGRDALKPVDTCPQAEETTRWLADFYPQSPAFSSKIR